MASTDYTTTPGTAVSGFRRILKSKDRGIVFLVFGTAFAFHLAALFNLLPS
ncbi:hypothetical protein [Phyllobacterium zundukense]|uniref:hypothetical protein n=1 Tax=Phyllobacterium zundukense TaxID=1867719 RepID=UPI0013000E86|nr:hypothetical protein [Phyllobacterium zundukense]